MQNYFRILIKGTIVVFVYSLFASSTANAQNKNDSIQYLDLDQCIVYALLHQPAVMQSSIAISITNKTNTINNSAWLPQVGVNGNFTHYTQLPTTFFANSTPGGPVIQQRTGIINTFVPQIAVSQVIFNPDVLNAAKSAHLYVELAKQSNDSTKINAIASVSKAFYSLLVTLEQINVLKEDTARLAKNLRDAYHQYIGGIVDQTDYKEAFISLNNSRAQLKQANESVLPLYATLKQLMGFPMEKNFSVSFDAVRMMEQIGFDTTQQIDYEKRIEYQLLQTVKKLQQQNVNYYRTQYLPSLSANYTYVHEFENNSVSNLFSQAYPYSFWGASISLPIFTGFRRTASIQRAKLQVQQIDWEIINLKARIYSEYSDALANYKSNLFDLKVLRDNKKMARDVYGVVSLQYQQGVIPYLNVITAESNLISSDISYLNALFQVLSNKVDLEKALGNTLSKEAPSQ